MNARAEFRALTDPRGAARDAACRIRAGAGDLDKGAIVTEGGADGPAARADGARMNAHVGAPGAGPKIGPATATKLEVKRPGFTT